MNSDKTFQITTVHFAPPHPLKTAVLFLVFNRPDTTKQVFEAIRKATPPRLYVAADGPRADKSGDAEKVEHARRIALRVDWDCEVKTLFREKNLGCQVGVSCAIDWFFENEEEGIILEDDCLPTQSFFWFCQELLEKYRNDERIMAISGNNFQFGRRRNEYSYYFSRFNHCWGWASWRRAWLHYDRHMRLWPYVTNHGYLTDLLRDRKAVRYWKNIFETTYQGHVDTWDYQWTFSCWIQNGLSILPNANLVCNIGFGTDSTHTRKHTPFAYMKTSEIETPLQHPQWVMVDDKADRITQQEHFSRPSLILHALKKLYRVALRIL